MEIDYPRYADRTRSYPSVPDLLGYFCVSVTRGTLEVLVAYRKTEDQKRASDKHYLANKQAYKDRAVARKQALRDEVKELKEASPCTDCGISYPYYVMHYDHLGLEEKVLDVSRLINKTASRVQVMNEIAKCELVCANCHAERTHQRRIVLV